MFRRRLLWRLFAINAAAFAVFLGVASAWLLSDPRQGGTGSIVAALVGMAVLGLIASFFAALTVYRPIERVRRAAEDLAKGDLNARVDTIGPDEVGDLAEAFNTMSRQLRTRMAELEGRRREVATIMENISEGLLLLNPAGEVALVNRAAQKLLGRRAADLVGKPLWQNLHLPEVHEMIAELPKIDEPARVRIELAAAGEARVAEMVVTPLFEISDGEKRAVLLIIDVTEDRRLDQMRRDFVADVSHELKTPLTSIKAYAETLLDGADQDEGARRPFLEKIVSNSNRLTKLVADILDISRLETGRKDDSRERSDLNALVRRVVGEFSERAAKKGVTLAFEPAAAAPEAYVNSEDMREAVENLIDNAINYTAEKGTVRVALKVADGRITVEVADTGIGIPADALPRVFERFYRVDRARSRAMGGTGLGLSIVKHVALRHGGNVEAASEVGKGSTFRILLPAA
ncbi:MAG: HAMP domain-containing protein [Planctomycetes bacterium]|nr:HAMP domain-containing protein [Planctomycetota bacterium]